MLWYIICHLGLGNKSLHATGLDLLRFSVIQTKLDSYCTVLWTWIKFWSTFTGSAITSFLDKEADAYYRLYTLEYGDGNEMLLQAAISSKS